MKFRLLTNNDDTIVGMRLAGIEGIKVVTAEETLLTLENLLNEKDTGVVMINKSLASLLGKPFIEIKKSTSVPIVEIPDKGGSDGDFDGITKYVADAISIKI